MARRVKRKIRLREVRKKKNVKGNLKELLRAYMDIEKIKLVPNSFDIIGHIAILEFPDELKKEKILIAKVLLDVHKNIQTVLEKSSERTGIYRVREYKFLAGKKKFETVHKEFGCKFKLNPKKVYFSPREITERQRIADQVKPGEKVLVMFSGVGPFSIIIAKRQSKAEVVGVEINKDAVKYAKENVILNRLSNVKNYLGDVRKVCPKLKQKFNRIVMPLPLGAENFLDVAVKCLKKNGIIHFYNWGDEDRLFSNASKVLRKKMKGLNKKYRVIGKRRVLPYAPHKWKVCLDVLVK
jgi:tRNA (guanine37-N1)-methyltransferase